MTPLLRRIARLLPDPIARIAVRHAIPAAVVGALFVVGAAIAATSLVSPGALGITAARLAETTELPDLLRSGELAARDADRDGLSDALENYLYGTDPERWDSSGTGIPDGWLVQHGIDPLSPVAHMARGASPPPSALPPAYRDGWPEKYSPPIADYYAWNKPDDYRPGVDAPWWTQRPSADPSRWDQSGTGIPTGWLVHYGLDPTAPNLDIVAVGSRGNLTVREAFQHDTNPHLADSDGDGIDDWVEIHVTRTDPSRFSTAQRECRTSSPGAAGRGASLCIADGWLIHFGLNAFDPDVANQDPDLDGLTNFEEFERSFDALREDVARDGIRILYTRGLDPLEWQTARTGIPDGWYVRYGLSPFGGEGDRVVARASDWPEVRNLADAPEGESPLPDLVMTVRDAYRYARPADWDESIHGVWWGGTDPATADSDADGIPDVVEIRGWYATITYDVGPDAKQRTYLASSNPLEADSDGDGLTDLEEYRGQTSCGTGTLRSFPTTDPRNRDSAFSGLTDREKVCGAVREGTTYDLWTPASGLLLDPTRADTAGDYLRDGPALDFWHGRWTALRANPRYAYPDSAYKTVFQWTERYQRFASLSQDDTLRQFRPDGDVDGDGIPNVVDADPSGGLYAARFASAGTPASKVFFLGGPQIDPELYRYTEFASTLPRAASDPANPDTDGDNLPDAWEVRYGIFDPVVGGWNLDPAKSDSDSDGIPDDKENADRDVVVWYAHSRRGTSTERVTHTFEFDNGLEFAAGTDPNTLSTAGDGISDGWKAFWGSRVSAETYPSLVAGRDARIGDVALAQAAAIESSISASAIQSGADLRGLGAKSTGYVRFVPLLTCDNAAEVLEAALRSGEALPRDPCTAEKNLTGVEFHMGRIEGVFALTYRQEYDLRTNPHVWDTDGDGAPDAYEAFYMARPPGGTAYPDPTVADAHRDPDEDGVGVADECRSPDGGRTCGIHVFTREGETYGAGSDPNRIDTDGDSIIDGIELGAGLNPLDPSDVGPFQDRNRDSDKDGIPDYLEIAGWGREDFGVAVRTDPANPDSDGDGLLDGPVVTLRPGVAADAALIREWRDRGIAHRTRADGNIDFLGERPFGIPYGMRPDIADSSGLGIPDGWLAYHNLNPTTTRVDAALYTLHRPSWWIEDAHGVWWWGEEPGAPPSGDLDGDGLDDASGEDPFPSLRLNRFTYTAVLVDDPRAAEAFVKGATSASEERVRAQRFGDGAGDPNAARAAARAAVDPNGVPTRLDRARVAIVEFAMGEGSEPFYGSQRITKGEPFVVSGRVVLDERYPGGLLIEGSAAERVGVANRTIYVSVHGPSRETLLGVGFSGPDGRFSFNATVADSGGAAIPAPGIVALGQVSGGVGWSLDPSSVSAGNTTAGTRNHLVLWTPNTSATVERGHPSHGQYRAWLPDSDGRSSERITNGTRYVTSPAIPITVFSSTRWTSTVADTAINGAFLVGDAKLVDASGAPVTFRNIVLRWDGAGAPLTLTNLSTDRDGRVNLTNLGLAASVTRADTYALVLAFSNASTSDRFLASVEQAFPIAIKSPATLAVEVSRASLTVGEGFVASGRLSTLDVRLATGAVQPAVAIPGAALTIALGGIETTTRTDERGEFSVRVTVPPNLDPGTQPLRVHFAGSRTETYADATVDIAVKRTATVFDLNRIEGPRASEAALRGRLVDNQGRGFVGVLDIFTASGVRVARTVSEPEGAFAVSVPFTQFNLGTQQVRVAFAGDANRAPAENFTTARVTSTTALIIDRAPDRVIRGDSFAVAARLIDDRGAPVEAQAVETFWRGQSRGFHVTDARGAIAFTILTNASEIPTAASLGLAYDPTGSVIMRPSTAGASVQVLAGSTLDLPAAAVERGAFQVRGRLLDDDGRPLSASPIRITFDGVVIGEARTARNGTFELGHALPRDRPLGAVTVRAVFPGTDRIARADVNATWLVQSALRLQLDTVGPFVRGEGAAFAGRLTDDNGKPLDGAFEVGLGNRTLGTLRVNGGKLLTSLPVPADAARGETTLTLTAPGTDRHPAFRETFPVVVKVRPKVEVDLPRLAVRGFSFGGDVVLLDDHGEPLRNTSFVYALGTGRSPIIGVTDAAGRAQLAAVAPLAGETHLTLTVRGGPDVVPAEYTTQSLKIVGPATPVGYVGVLLGALAAAALIALVVIAVIVRRRQLAEIRDIVEETIRELLAGNEFAGTIFLAYRKLAAHLARNGYAEKASETPREFATGVRKAMPVSASALRELIRLFEVARYSDHAIGSVERDRAIESLATVRNELDAILGRKKEAPR